MPGERALNEIAFVRSVVCATTQKVMFAKKKKKEDRSVLYSSTFAFYIQTITWWISFDVSFPLAHEAHSPKNYTNHVMRNGILRVCVLTSCFPTEINASENDVSEKPKRGIKRGARAWKTTQLDGGGGGGGNLMFERFQLSSVSVALPELKIRSRNVIVQLNKHWEDKIVLYVCVCVCVCLPYVSWRERKDTSSVGSFGGKSFAKDSEKNGSSTSLDEKILNARYKIIVQKHKCQIYFTQDGDVRSKHQIKKKKKYIFLSHHRQP